MYYVNINQSILPHATAMQIPKSSGQELKSVQILQTLEEKKLKKIKTEKRKHYVPGDRCKAPKLQEEKKTKHQKRKKEKEPPLYMVHISPKIHHNMAHIPPRVLSIGIRATTLCKATPDTLTPGGIIQRLHHVCRTHRAVLT
jgi:hypothetical protein